ncbi:hypothetical protein [Streptomyces sp. bgisy027]|uniref:hypothetical protein n=1 Tax=Streptomyces sp. bgisy027 TaxID=3413770 RepID=UPI003D7574A2
MGITSAEAFVVMLVALTATYGVLVLGIPWVVRLIFQLRVERVHNACMNAMLDGKLPYQVPVERFLKFTSWMANNPKFFSPSRRLALTLARNKLSDDVGECVCSHRYASLSDDQRDVMQTFSAELQRAWDRYVRWGGWVSWLLYPVYVLTDRMEARRALREGADDDSERAEVLRWIVARSEPEFSMKIDESACRDIANLSGV